MSEYSNSEILLRHPFTTMIAGPTSSGKTVLTRKLIESFRSITTINLPQISVIWCYGQWQNGYTKPIEGAKVDYFEGLCDEDYLVKHKPHLIVVDDLMSEVAGDKRMADLFTKVSHHENISVIFIVQNIFYQAKFMRTISINTHYFFLLKNPRDRSQIMTFGRQLYPNDSKFFIEAYDDATSEPYSYLLVDVSPRTPDKLRLRSKITPRYVKQMKKTISSPTIYFKRK